MQVRKERGGKPDVSAAHAHLHKLRVQLGRHLRDVKLQLRSAAVAPRGLVGYRRAERGDALLDGLVAAARGRLDLAEPVLEGLIKYLCCREPLAQVFDSTLHPCKLSAHADLDSCMVLVLHALADISMQPLYSLVQRCSHLRDRPM